jgi:hypothetical protein
MEFVILPCLYRQDPSQSLCYAWLTIIARTNRYLLVFHIVPSCMVRG